jgi:(2Fe-2S) ferredoxin
MVVYPQGIWYSMIDTEDVAEIIDSHLMQGKPVERLMI